MSSSSGEDHGITYPDVKSFLLYPNVNLLKSEQEIGWERDIMVVVRTHLV